MPPLRLTLPHRFDFGSDSTVVGEDLGNAQSWDRLRLETAGPFAASASEEELRGVSEREPALRARAAAIASEANGRRVASYGAGAGVLERCLLDEGATLTVTEYAPRTVELLSRLLPEASVVAHDLTSDAPVQAELHLLHRVDTELDDSGWRDFFTRFAAERIIVMPAGVIEPRALPATLVRVFRMRHAVRAGWLRTRPALTSLWDRTHEASRRDLAGAEAWQLEPRG